MLDYITLLKKENDEIVFSYQRC
ncbi:hypothetical protein [Methanospirillum purgamenti]